MSASTSTASTKQQLRTVARAQRRHLAAEKKRQAARQRAEQQEQRDEAVAPRVQHLLGCGDTVIVLAIAIGLHSSIIELGPARDLSGVCTFVARTPISRLRSTMVRIRRAFPVMIIINHSQL